MTATATLVDDREDDRLYRVQAGPPGLPSFLLVSRYGSRTYDNQMTCVWHATEEGETVGAPLATYYGAMTHDDAIGRILTVTG